MSDWYMGQLADESMPFAAAAFPPAPPAWPEPAPPAQPYERDAFEAAALTNRRPYRNLPAPGSSNMEAVAEALIPQQPWEYGLMLALPGAGLAGRAFAQLPKVARMGALAAGIGTTATEAEAAPWSKVWSAISPYDAAKVAKSGQLEDYHRIANRKLARPLEEIPVEYGGALPRAPTRTPAQLEGKVLTPLVGDPTMAGRTIKSIDDIPLTTPLRTLGGHGYIRETGGYANDAPMATTIANRVKGLSQYFDTDQIIGAHTKMGPQSGDFSHHTWGALSRMLPNAELTRAAKKELNEAVMGEIAAIKPTPAMKKAKEEYDWPKWPGVTSPRLEQHLASQPDSYRKAFINAMEKAAGKVENVPSVVSARYASTDPALLNAPTGSSGLSMTRLTGGIRKSGHPDFPTHLEGEKAFSLGRPVPKEVMFPEIIERFDKQQPPDRWARKMYMPPAKAQHGQLATPRWVDDTSRYLENVEQMGEVAALNKYITDRFGWK